MPACAGFTDAAGCQLNRDAEDFSSNCCAAFTPFHNWTLGESDSAQPAKWLIHLALNNRTFERRSELQRKLAKSEDLGPAGSLSEFRALISAEPKPGVSNAARLG
jgi:hypothetical protein